MKAKDGSSSVAAPGEPGRFVYTPGIKVDDKVRYRAIEGRYHDSSGNPAGGMTMNVVAWITKVHDANTIDIAWRGESGNHPASRPELELHTRERVARIGRVPASQHPVLAGKPPEFCNHDGMREHVQWETI